MYKVMLIEDEPPILQMVKEMIDSSPQGFVVSHTAFNGQKALKLLDESEEKPDLIMTDIRMPIMDGLQLMRELEIREYNIPCIILSGYNDFNYAREALKFRAFDYMLKPLKEELLEQSLAKAKGLLFRRREAGVRRFLKKMLRLPDDSGIEPANPGYTAYQLLLVRKGNHRNDEWEELSPISSKWSGREADLLRELFSDGNDTPSWQINGLTSNEKIVVRGLADPKAEVLGRHEAEVLQTEWKSRNGIVDRSVCFAASGQVGPDRLASSFRELREALASETGIGESKVWVYGEPIKLGFVLTAEMEQACRNLAKSADYRSFEKAVLGWKEEWRRGSLGQLAIESLLTTVVRMFKVQRQAEGEPSTQSFDANELVFGCGTLDEVAEQFCAFMREEYERSRGSRTDRSAKDLIVNVRKYLDDHYMEPIGNEKLQQMFGYHKTYISNVFSEVVGIPPGKYLTKLRIDKAIVLINDRSELSLRQIAEQVGYEDSLYFSKVFKSATGLSPKEYKERRERDAANGSK